jgi:hypothetical protein
MSRGVSMRFREFFTALFALATLVTLSGCYRVTHDLDSIASPDSMESSWPSGMSRNAKALGGFRAEVHSSHLLWGLVNPGDRFVKDIVRREVRRAGGTRATHVRLTREVNVSEWLLGVVTLGIYSPWSLVIEGEVLR